MGSLQVAALSANTCSQLADQAGHLLAEALQSNATAALQPSYLQQLVADCTKSVPGSARSADTGASPAQSTTQSGVSQSPHTQRNSHHQKDLQIQSVQPHSSQTRAAINAGTAWSNRIKGLDTLHTEPNHIAMVMKPVQPGGQVVEVLWQLFVYASEAELQLTPAALTKVWSSQAMPSDGHDSTAQSTTVAIMSTFVCMIRGNETQTG